jgi:hypothetical protein
LKIFATRVWGFDPVRWPVITFGLAASRDKLIRDSEPGDKILFIGTKSKPTPKEMQGKLLGIAEIGRRAVDTLDVVGPDARGPWDFDERGLFRWPKGIMMLRAWRFDPMPELLEVLAAQLPYNATPQAVLLSEQDAVEVMKLEVFRVDLPDTQIAKSERLLDKALAAGRPTTGPMPVSWTGSTARDINRKAFTYAFRFGHSKVWKIGHTVDLAARLKQVNQHIPSEVIPGLWGEVYRHPWDNEADAYAMEQRILNTLQRYRTEGERLQCTEDELWSAWKAAIGL